MNIQSFTNLNNRSVIGVSGEETFDFLQSIVTGDISLLLEGKSVASCLLSPQGRVLFDFILHKNFNDKKGLSVFVDCEKLETEDIIKKLKIYRLRSKIDIINLTDWNVCLCPNETVNSTADPRHMKLPKRVIAKVGLGKNDQGLELEYNRLRHELCLPEGSKEIPRGEALPLDYWMDKTGHISFNKGCFVGQEVTARIFHRNKIRRRLIILDADFKGFSEGHDFNREFKLMTRTLGRTFYLVSVNFLENLKSNFISYKGEEIKFYSF